MYNSVFQDSRRSTFDGKSSVFLPLEIKVDQFNRYFPELLKHSQVYGINITTPYKTLITARAAQYGITLDRRAKRTSVASFCYKLKGKNEARWFAGVADGEGWCRAAEELLFKYVHIKTPLHRKRITLFGAGGAGRAILEALDLPSRKPSSITIVEPSEPRAADAKRVFKHILSGVDHEVQNHESRVYEAVQNSDILINATELGKANQETPLINSKVTRPGTFVFDLNWWPSPRTLFLDDAKRRGAFIFNGLRMAAHVNTIIITKWIGLNKDEGVTTAIYKKIYAYAVRAGFREAEEVKE